MDMGDSDYLIYGFSITILIIILNLAAFISIPLIISKFRAKELNKSK